MQGADNKDNYVKIDGMAPYLQVFDMPVALAFYRDVLGFTVAMQSEPELKDDCNWVLLRKEGVELMLNTMYEKKNRLPVANTERYNWHADTTLYFGCPHVDAMYNQLAGKGFKIKEPVITQYRFKAIYITDPDGYHICFHWPVE